LDAPDGEGVHVQHDYDNSMKIDGVDVGRAVYGEAKNRKAATGRNIQIQIVRSPT
jgi:hypothetical protein